MSLRWLLGLLLPFGALWILFRRKMKTRVHQPGEKLTPNFTYDELGLTYVSDPVIIENMRILALDLLEPLRAEIGGKILIGSGYRDADRNREVGGVPNSQHLYGQAADIKAYDRTGNKIQPPKLAALIRQKFQYDKLIQYLPGTKGYPNGGVHVSYVRGRNRKEFIIKNDRPNAGK